MDWTQQYQQTYGQPHYAGGEYAHATDYVHNAPTGYLFPSHAYYAQQAPLPPVFDFNDDFGADILERLSFSDEGGGALKDPGATITHEADVHQQLKAQPVMAGPLPFPAQVLAADNIAMDSLPSSVRKNIAERRNDFALEFKIPPLKKKYYRSDVKVLHCFPYCEKFADYREARLLGNDHVDGKNKGSNVCYPSIVLSLHVPPATDVSSLHVRGRFLQVTPDVRSLPDGEPVYEVGDVLSSLPERQCYTASVQPLCATDAQGWQELKVVLNQPSGWSMQLELTRSRRNATDNPARVPLFLFEVLVMQQVGPQSFRVASRCLSTLFEVASSRTLLREVLMYRELSGNPALAYKKKKSAASENHVNKHPRLSRAPVYDSQRHTLAPVALEIKPKRGFFSWLPFWAESQGASQASAAAASSSAAAAAPQASPHVSRR